MDSITAKYIKMNDLPVLTDYADKDSQGNIIASTYAKGIYYIGNSTESGTAADRVWNIQNNNIVNYYDGLTLIIKVLHSIGTSSTVININDLGNKFIYCNIPTSGGNYQRILPQYPINSILTLVYNNSLSGGVGGWMIISDAYIEQQLMTPSSPATTTITNHEAIFTFTNAAPFNSTYANKWMGTFSMGRCSFMIPLYALTQNDLYKCPGSFIYNGESGAVTTTTINYQIISDNQIKIWSGNTNYLLPDSYTAYLFLIKLY